jgi:hypothetical protein
MKLAPIVLFVYNRPWHTQQCLESLYANELAKDSILYVYSDGLKNNADDNETANVAEVRKLLKAKNWCSKVIIKERTTNIGLANSVVHGVTEIVNKHGRIIVIEDDLVLSKGFLSFMNKGLTLYQNNQNVMSITGYSFFNDGTKPDKTYFLKGGTSTWGWGTWSKSWKIFNYDSTSLYKKIIERNLESQFNLDNTYGYLNMLKAQINGKIDSWGIRWYASVFLAGGLGLWPNKSLVQNIGHDGTGVHCPKSSKLQTSELSHHFEIELIETQESLQYKKNVISYYKNINAQSFSDRIKTRIINALNRIIP